MSTRGARKDSQKTETFSDINTIQISDKKLLEKIKHLPFWKQRLIVTVFEYLESSEGILHENQRHDNS